MKLGKRSVLMAGLAAVLVVSGALPLSATDDEAPALVTTRLFEDGSVSCTGADDTMDSDGKVFLLPQPTGVHFTVRLRGAAPNTPYTLVVSREPNCASPQTFGTKTTDSSGNANFFGTYTGLPAGSHNLLFNLVTTSTPTDPKDREIATRNARVVVPTA
jgi:hypothetical protein